MRVESLSLADRVAAVGVVVLAVGTYLTWGVQPAPATLGQSFPWEATGFYAGRAVVLVPPIGYALLRVAGAGARVEGASLALSAVACVVYPPYRIRMAPLSDSVPSFGFVFVTVSGLLFAGAAAIRYAETAGIGTGAPSPGQPVDGPEQR